MDTGPLQYAVRIRRSPSRSGPLFTTTWDPKGADFAMQLGVFYCAKLNAPPLFAIVRDGVAYARVYDIRGSSISSLLTVPGIDKTHY